MRPHTLTLKEEELLNAIAPHVNDWPGELYQKTLDHTKWGTVKTASGELDVRPLLSRVGQLGDWKTCFDGMHEGSLIKAVLKP